MTDKTELNRVLYHRTSRAFNLPEGISIPNSDVDTAFLIFIRLQNSFLRLLQYNFQKSWSSAFWEWATVKEKALSVCLWTGLPLSHGPGAGCLVLFPPSPWAPHLKCEEQLHHSAFQGHFLLFLILKLCSILITQSSQTLKSLGSHYLVKGMEGPGPGTTSRFHIFSLGCYDKSKCRHDTEVL